MKDLARSQELDSALAAKDAELAQKKAAFEDEIWRHTAQLHECREQLRDTIDAHAA